MIKVNNLTKIYKTPQKKPGLTGFVKDIFKREYKEILAVDNISFEIAEGELIGFLGPNGAGKTTTLKMLTGILYPTSGSIDILGYWPFDKKQSFLKQIAFIAGQKNQLLWDLPAFDSFNLNKEIYEIENKQFNETLDKLTKLLDCQDLLSQPVKTLSLGQRMKMELIGALTHQPKILFLDEPTIGLDVVAQKTIRDFIVDYQKLYSATIILTSHYMEDIKALCKKVMIINKGKIIYNGQLDDLIKKYATRKTIEVIVDSFPDLRQLEKIDKNVKLEFPKLIFHIKREDIPKKISLITEKIKFSDLNIYEERVEDIIRKIFNK